MTGLIEWVVRLFGEFGAGAYDAVGGVLGWLVGTFANFILFVAAALPSNPLDIGGLIGNLGNWVTGMGWLNWFVPIGNIELILTAWVAATVAFYSARYVFAFIGKRFWG